MMGSEKGWLTTARAEGLTRILLAAALLSLLAGLLLLIPLREGQEPAPPVATVAPRPPERSAVQFPGYAEMEVGRGSPFEFVQTKRAQVAWKEAPTATPVEAPKAPPPPPPPPRPDLTGLQLVGVAAGGRVPRAMTQEGSGALMVYSLGSPLRNARVIEIHPYRVVAAIGEERAELPLQRINGSEQWQRRISTPEPPPSTAGQPDPPKGWTRMRRVKTRSLGVYGYMLTYTQLQKYGLSEPGLLVTRVGRPRSGLLAGDVILEIEGRPVHRLGDVADILQRIEGDTARLSIQREGAVVPLAVALE